MRTLSFAILLALLAVASAAPVPKELVKIESLEGTTWSGDGVVAPTVYTFEMGGGLTYTYGGTRHTAGTWKQDGNRVYWESNNRYCEFDGTFQRGAMSGKAHNIANGKWDLKMTRVK